MRIPYFQINAFTGEGLRGNPAGVCLLEDWPGDDVLLGIAAENDLSETSFLIRREGHFDLRWFTPKIEVDLCGHATLAAAFVVLHYLDRSAESVAFETQSGRLTVSRDGERLSMDFPALVAEPCEAPEALVRGLGIEPSEVLRARDYLAVVENEGDVALLKPNFDALSELDCLGTIVTAPGARSDFVSRFFAPRAGIPEDPVTGSAHCTLAPYWSRRLGKPSLRALQLSSRGGEIFCEDLGERVRIAGRATAYLEGNITP